MSKFGPGTLLKIATTALAASLALGMPGGAAAAEKTLADVQKKVSTRITQAQREAAAKRQAELRAKVRGKKALSPAKPAPGTRVQPAPSGAAAKSGKKTVVGAGATATASGLVSTASVSTLGWPDPSPLTRPGGIPDYFGAPNWGFSPPLRKFVDRLPGLGPQGANNLGQYISVAHPDTVTYPGSDYYEIELREFDEQLHSDLPATRLRGYVQVNHGTDGNGMNTIAPDPIHYLGATIVARRDRPVRIKFTNKLSIGAGGDLFIPVDTSIMGAGEGPKDASGNACDPEMEDCASYTQNRATLHLHGGRTPWISDGTPHQWITPAGEPTQYPKGVSVEERPGHAGPGRRLDDVLLHEPAERAPDVLPRPCVRHHPAQRVRRRGGGLHHPGPGGAGSRRRAGSSRPSRSRSSCRTRSFVDASTIRVTDPTWNWGTGGVDSNGYREPRTGDLWYPHVYSPAQNPYDLGGANSFGRWHYGPWFWPPTTNIKYLPVPNPYYDPDNAPWEPPEMPATPNPSMPGESFMDTAMVNGTAVPVADGAAEELPVPRPQRGERPLLQPAAVRRRSERRSPADGRTQHRGEDGPRGAHAGLPGRLAGGRPRGRRARSGDPRARTSSRSAPRAASCRCRRSCIPNQPVAWNLDPTTFNFGNVSDHALLLGPAERADVIVDFSQYAGQTLILYNDAPAAFPARRSARRLLHRRAGPDRHRRPRPARSRASARTPARSCRSRSAAAPRRSGVRPRPPSRRRSSPARRRRACSIRAQDPDRRRPGRVRRGLRHGRSRRAGRTGATRGSRTARSPS